MVFSFYTLYFKLCIFDGLVIVDKVIDSTKNTSITTFTLFYYY